MLEIFKDEIKKSAKKEKEKESLEHEIKLSKIQMGKDFRRQTLMLEEANDRAVRAEESSKRAEESSEKARTQAFIANAIGAMSLVVAFIVMISE